MTMSAYKINSPRVHDRDRLVGGADVSEEPAAKSEVEPAIAVPVVPELDTEVSDIPLPSSDLPPTPVDDTVQPAAKVKDPENKQSLPASGPCCVCISRTPGLVG
ncbi:SH3 domain-containing protein C23A1.17-like [Harpegnathos saltator]|nr:SH3 domain-containing protein C23A1.17-like [Harpegnathos saltator]